jgi:hypothetical protein
VPAAHFQGRGGAGTGIARGRGRGRADQAADVESAPSNASASASDAGVRGRGRGGGGPAQRGARGQDGKWGASENEDVDAEFSAAMARLCLAPAAASLEPSIALAKVQSGELVSGPLRVNAKNTQEAFVAVEGLTRDVAVIGHERRARALEGDIVALSLLPLEPAAARGGDVQRKGLVVAVLEQKHRVMHIGHLKPAGDATFSVSRAENEVLFEPHDSRLLYYTHTHARTHTCTHALTRARARTHPRTC